VSNQQNIGASNKGLAAKSKSSVGWLMRAYNPLTWKEKGILWTLGMLLVTYGIIVLILGIYWSREPDLFDVQASALEKVGGDQSKLVAGSATVAAAIRIADTLLDKPGGYLTNDVTPPSIYLDNLPNWEFGALVELRETVRALRNDFSRSQTQSIEDRDLAIADPQFHFDSESWILPATETEYRKGVEGLYRYLTRLADSNDRDVQFFTRADNLSAYLSVVAQRLGSLAQRLSASVGENRINIDLAGHPQAEQSTPTPAQSRIQTPWLEIDDVFYEARGYTWALLHMFKALAIDFQRVLRDKNAEVSLQQIIRELESASAPMWSPFILNGTGFGLLANHSLVMASYLSRANAAVLDLRDLMLRG